MIHIYVRRNADGCERRVTMKDIPFVAEEWIEGIYHCDCQRRRFFHMANGEPFDAHEHGANKLCGAGAYSVRITDKGHNHLYVDPTFWPQPAA